MKNLLLNEIYYLSNLDYVLGRTEIRCKAKELLYKFKIKHKGKKVVVVGNGPSLNKTPLKLLEIKREEYSILSSNGFFLYSNEHNVFADLICVEDPFPAEEMKNEIINYPALKVIPFDLIGITGKQINKNISYIDFRRRMSLYNLRGHKFSTSINKVKFYWGGTVTYLLLQIAASLEPEKVILVGCDLNYKVSNLQKVKHNVFSSKEDDVNHFSKEYFRNKRWHNPKTERMKKAFDYANNEYKRLGIPLYNCSPGTSIESIEKKEWQIEAQ